MLTPEQIHSCFLKNACIKFDDESPIGSRHIRIHDLDATLESVVREHTSSPFIHTSSSR